MANGFDPYALAQGLIDTTEAGYGAQQAQRMGDISVAEQVGQMGEEFQKDKSSAEREQERILAKQRKPGNIASSGRKLVSKRGDIGGGNPSFESSRTAKLDWFKTFAKGGQLEKEVKNELDKSINLMRSGGRGF